MEEFLKTIRNSHYLLLFSCVALILISYSSYLTRIYQRANDEITAFEKISIRRFFETKEWDMQVGGPRTSLGGLITNSMPKVMQELFARQNNSFFDHKQVFLKIDGDYRNMVNEAMKHGRVRFAKGFDFSRQSLLPFSYDPRVSLRLTEGMTLQEIYEILNSAAARRPILLFVPDERRFNNVMDEIVAYYKSGSVPIGAFYFEEVRLGLDPKTGIRAPLGILVTCSSEVVLAQGPRRCSIPAGATTGSLITRSILGADVPVVGTSLQDWIVNQDNSTQFAIHTGKPDVKLEYFPNLRLIWSEVRFMTIDKAKAYLSDRRATYTQELPIEGLKASGQSALVLGPILLLILLIMLRSHLGHLRSTAGTLPDFPWIGLYDCKVDKLFTATSIVLMPVAACILEAIFFSYFTALIWICSVCAPLLLYIGILTIKDLNSIRRRRNVPT